MLSTLFRRVGCRAFLAAGVLLLPACQGAAFYERRHLSSPLMAFEQDATRIHAMQKVYYSREGSTGGIGSTAGGGCGCAN